MPQSHEQYVVPLFRALIELGGSAKPAEACEVVFKTLGLTESPLREKPLKDGSSWLNNQIAWARNTLAEMGVVDRTKRGVWTLTEAARTTRDTSDAGLQQRLIDIQRSRLGTMVPAVTTPATSDESTPEESGYKARLLDILKGLPPAGFEQLCQQLLRESGFEKVEVTGRSGDGGIDGVGVLRVNSFVSFNVLFQCKRYTRPVGSPEIRNFRGAMSGRTDKGIFLTTDVFTSEAVKEATREGVPPIELVDGANLIELFEELELGLVPRTTYDVDPHFFAQFQSKADEASAS